MILIIINSFILLSLYIYIDKNISKDKDMLFLKQFLVYNLKTKQVNIIRKEDGYYKIIFYHYDYVSNKKEYFILIVAADESLFEFLGSKLSLFYENDWNNKLNKMDSNIRDELTYYMKFKFIKNIKISDYFVVYYKIISFSEVILHYDCRFTTVVYESTEGKVLILNFDESKINYFLH